MLVNKRKDFEKKKFESESKEEFENNLW